MTEQNSGKSGDDQGANWLALGIAVGVAIGSGLGAAKKRNGDDSGEN